MTLSIPHHHVAKPTEAQKDAGNYRKAHVRIHSLDVTIENPKGSTRAGKDADGKAWRVSMPAHYGYIRQTSGADADHVDCYIGPNPKSDRVYIVNQVDAKTKTFDEHKCMLGYSSRNSALKDYVNAFSDGKGRDRMGGCVEMSIDQFKTWVKSHSTKAPARSRYDSGGAVYPYDGTSVLQSHPMAPPSRADFLRSEKDTRLWNDTVRRSLFLHYAPSPYNGAIVPEPSAIKNAFANIVSDRPEAWNAVTQQLARKGNTSVPEPQEPSLSDTSKGIGEFLGSAPQAVTFPARALRGDVPMWDYDPEQKRSVPSARGISEAHNLVGWTMVGGGAATKPKGSAGVFAGREAAERLAAKGETGGAAGVLGNRELDKLGYYSQALEQAKLLPNKASADQVLATLRNAGVKQGEIDATGLGKFLEGKPQVSRDDVVSYLRDNRVRPQEVQYLSDKPAPLDTEALNGAAQHYYGENYDALGADSQRLLRQELGMADRSETKWSSFSLSHSNPTYRESLLHLPAGPKVAPQPIIRRRNDGTYSWKIESRTGSDGGIAPTEASAREIGERRAQSMRPFDAPTDFRSNHWSEPNVIAHMRTSMVKDAQGRNVFHLDELQSDWGQRLRDGGVRDEAKIAELSKRIDDLTAQHHQNHATFPRNKDGFIESSHAAQYDKTLEDIRLAQAEFHNAQAATSGGHPLVNTTDQWVNTSLRRALRQAAEADADALAIPSGRTIQKYGMGADEAGNAYAYDKMYPKKLRSIIQKFDKNVQGEFVSQLMDQSGAAIPRSAGHTVFPLSPEVRKRILDEGMPLFSGTSTPTGVAGIGQSDRDAVKHIIERWGVEPTTAYPKMRSVYPYDGTSVLNSLETHGNRALAPVGDEIKEWAPPKWQDQAGDWLSQKLMDHGMTRNAAVSDANRISSLLGFIPPIAAHDGGVDIGEGYRSGDYGQMGAGAIGVAGAALPFAGRALSRGAAAEAKTMPMAPTPWGNTDAFLNKIRAAPQPYVHPLNVPEAPPAGYDDGGAVIERSKFTGELSDPALRQRLAALAYRETGGQGQQAQQAFLETVFNRAAARGKTIAETISGRDGYYPNVSLQPVTASKLNGISPLIDTVMAGSNLSNGATGNASGSVGFNGGQATYAVNGERFGREGPDLSWTVPYNALGGRDAQPADVTTSSSKNSSQSPIASVLQRISVSPVSTDTDGNVTWSDGTMQGLFNSQFMR